MTLRFNDDIVGEIVRADLRGASDEEMRNLYIQRNVFEVDLDTPVYRIIELQYFREDLSEKCLTYTKIDKSNWGDSTENPLLDREFKDEVTGGVLTLNGVVATVYGSCWSATALDGQFDWAIFSRRKPSVRVQSTPRKLLDAAMSRGNKFYMLQHAIGKMQYATDAEIETHFSDPNWQKHLDSLGQGIAASFLRLSENLSSEDEVRLIYDHSSEAWPTANVRIVDRFAKVPFDWVAAVDGVVVGPFAPDGEETKIRSELQGFGINCAVSSSSTRTSVG
ncbi:hypothetical protein ACRPM7_03030 [Burkholderia vietnamiensis]|uniref:hypothetical protein n=1 Tax=Burkholderia vietnamiensis TaxID=60552 RepID=UPI001ADC05C0|nr:hypothetical protein [Burkholderia vietnamiensis]QTK83527.1 hypothetical protein J4D21_08915 [Burkholderia vietnamiensis]